MTVDVEAQCHEHSQAQKGEAKAERRWCWCRKRLLLPMMGLASIFIGATVALWPRKPNWVLRSLDILDQEALTFFVMAFSNGGLPGNVTSLPRIPFNASASVENPNLLGGTALPGAFNVYDDGDVIATGSDGASIRKWPCVGDRLCGAEPNDLHPVNERVRVECLARQHHYQR